MGHLYAGERYVISCTAEWEGGCIRSHAGPSWGIHTQEVRGGYVVGYVKSCNGRITLHAKRHCLLHRYTNQELYLYSCTLNSNNIAQRCRCGESTTTSHPQRTSCILSKARAWSSVSMDGDRPPCRQKICQSVNNNHEKQLRQQPGT